MFSVHFAINPRPAVLNPSFCVSLVDDAVDRRLIYGFYSYLYLPHLELDLELSFARFNCKLLVEALQKGPLKVPDFPLASYLFRTMLAEEHAVFFVYLHRREFLEMEGKSTICGAPSRYDAEHALKRYSLLCP